VEISLEPRKHQSALGGRLCWNTPHRACRETLAPAERRLPRCLRRRRPRHSDQQRLMRPTWTCWGSRSSGDADATWLACVPPCPPSMFDRSSSALASPCAYTRDATAGFSGRLAQRWPSKRRTRDRLTMRRRRGGSRGSFMRGLRFRHQNERAGTSCSVSRG
jgi:hypothetical protein